MRRKEEGGREEWERGRTGREGCKRWEGRKRGIGKGKGSGSMVRS